MNYAFMGTPEFAAIILKELIMAGFAPKIVICNPDRPVGRKKIITPPPAKQIAMQHKIPVLQPEKLGLESWKFGVGDVDFAVIAAYAMIIPKEILKLPKLGTIGVHPSLLPKYRGATPIQSAILNGNNETGVTLFLTDDEIDHGPILASSKLQITNDDTYKTLYKKLVELGAELLIENITKFTKGEMKPIQQNDDEAIYAGKFTTGDAFIKPEDLEKAQKEGGDIVLKIDRKIRALNPEPGTWTLLGGKRTKLLEAAIIEGKLKLIKTQVAGKKPIEISK